MLGTKYLQAKHREFGTQKRSNSLLLSKKHAITNRILQACPVTSCERGDSVRYGDAGELKYACFHDKIRLLKSIYSHVMQ